ncbi:AfsR/SARP family transcriptional regulator [Thermogemmatispora carboxidivorans]|uniref:AfsR/SARP family transcriptional regulator n=1 Tax=Thermogemmatispora carboxidivorans TaxID=1382306 RepID=UPI00069C29C1|nr:BTAD domain-containing putative transcriptional regulator [Thermogemmatispora carboxidivorans]
MQGHPAISLVPHVSSSCRLRVYLYGPLEVWKRNPDDSWSLLDKAAWGKGRPARSVFKRLLTAPGRHLSRAALQEDLWPDIDQAAFADKMVYSAVNQIRRAIGKELVRTLETGYALADQSIIWVDHDACRGLLAEAENWGGTTDEAVPLLEQILTYQERGELLEGEDGTWVYGVRQRGEEMLKQCRRWLAVAYERQGKLWQAGEQYRALFHALPPDEEALRAWITMLLRHGRVQEALRCYQLAKEAAEAQGFPLSFHFDAQALPPQQVSFSIPFAFPQLLPPFPHTSDESVRSDLVIVTEAELCDRLTTLLAQPAMTGQREIRYFDQQTRLYWMAREEQALPPPVLYSAVVKYLESLTLVLASARTADCRQRLCATISRTALLAGVLLYDRGHSLKARTYYRLAMRAAAEAGDPALQAVIWGWKSFTWTYASQYRKALHCIQAARQLAPARADRLLYVWLTAVEAEILAHLGHRDACLQNLRFLEQEGSSAQGSDLAFLVEFQPGLLLGYKGVCLQLLYQRQQLATLGLLREAQGALEQALTTTPPPRRKLYYLSDLASAYARQGEIEHACTYVTQCLALLAQLGEQPRAAQKHLFQVQELLQPYQDVAAVRALKEQLRPFSLKG